MFAARWTPWLCGVLLAGWAVGVCAATAEVDLTADFTKISLAGHGYFLDDPPGELGFAEVLAAPTQRRFIPLPGALGRGYTTATSWLRVDLVNRTAETQRPMLRLAPQMLDHLDVYVQQAGAPDSAEHYQHYPLGDHTPASVKRQTYPVMGVPVTVPPGQSRRIYLRVQTTSSHLLGVELVAPDLFAREAVISLVWVSSYIALAFGLTLVTFLQAARLRDLTHALYGLLPLGLGLNSIGTEGMTAILLPGTAHWINDGLLGLSGMLSFGGLSLFAMRLFQTARYHPWGHRYLQVITLLAVAAFLASGTAWYGRIVTPLMAMGLLLWVFLTWAGWRMIRRGEKTLGRLFLAAFTLPMLGASVALSRYLGWLPQNEWTQYLMPITSLIHMVLMNLALSERLLEAEAHFREAAQKAALESGYRREQEQLLTMISHEIRTPVAIIDAATLSLQALDPSPVPERAERYERIGRAVNRLGVLLDLTVAQGRANVADWQPERRRIEPADLCASAVELLDPPLAPRIQIAAAEPLPVILGDHRMLRFALLNLLDNACHYSPPGSPVRVTIAAVDEGVVWRVEDEGPGIPPGLEERIFEKYIRISEASGKAGLGLGLYLARQIAQAHGGWLRARPGAAVGACFECWLPATAAAGAPR